MLDELINSLSLFVSRIWNEEIELRVNWPDNTTSTVTMLVTENISDLKMWIYWNKNYNLKDQLLVYRGKILTQYEPLKNIDTSDRIFVFLRQND